MNHILRCAGINGVRDERLVGTLVIRERLQQRLIATKFMVDVVNVFATGHKAEHHKDEFVRGLVGQLLLLDAYLQMVGSKIRLA